MSPSYSPPGDWPVSRHLGISRRWCRVELFDSLRRGTRFREALLCGIDSMGVQALCRVAGVVQFFRALDSDSQSKYRHVESASRRVQAIGGERRKFLLNALQLLLDV